MDYKDFSRNELIQKISSLEQELSQARQEADSSPPFNHPVPLPLNLIEYSSDIVALLDASFNVIYHNPATSKITGFSPEYFRINNFTSIFDPDDGEQIKKQMVSDFDKKIPSSTYTAKIITRDKTVKWLELIVDRFFDKNGNFLNSVVVGRDITSRLDNQKEINNFFNLPLHILLIAKSDGTILRTNPAWNDVLGYSEKEIAGANFLNFVHPDDIQKTIDEMGKLQTGETLFYFENRYLDRSGNYHWLLWSGLFLNQEGVYYGIAHDITERKNAENALKLNEKELSSILANPEGYLIYQLHNSRDQQETQVTKVSPSIIDVLGIDPSNKYNFNKWFEILHPEDLPLLLEAHQRGSLPPFQLDIQVRFIHKKKGLRWGHIRSNGTPYEDNPSLIEYANGIIFDITEQKRIEEALRDSEMKLKAISENAPGIVFQFKMDKSKNFTFPYVSQGISILYGLSKEEISKDASSFLEKVYKDDRQQFYSSILESAEHLSPFHLSFRITNKENSIKWLNTRSLPFKQPDDSIIWMGIAIDITEQKMAEQALLESENTLMAIFNHAPVVMMLLDENTEIIALNNTGLYYAGKKPEQAIGMRGGDLLNCIGTLNNPHGCGAGPRCKTCTIRNTVAETLFTGDSRHKIEADIMVQNDLENETRTVLVSSSMVNLNSGNRILVTIDDITDRKKIENRLVEYKEHLEEIVEERTRELQLSNSLLEDEIKKQKESEQKVKESLEKEKELNRLKTEFVSMVSHEFRTPLTSILASADLLEINGKKENYDKYFNHIYKIQASVENMTRMLNDVLAISRAERGRMLFAAASTNLSELCLDIVEEERRRLSREKFIDFSYNAVEKYSSLDPNLIRQFLGNIISNSIKFTPAEGKISLTVNDTGTEIIFIVEDEGIGISSEEQSKIMEPFVRGSEVENIPGTGLGMTIIQNAVEMHNGKLTFRSEHKKGSKFIVTLPVEKNLSSKEK